MAHDPVVALFADAHAVIRQLLAAREALLVVAFDATDPRMRHRLEVWVGQPALEVRYDLQAYRLLASQPVALSCSLVCWTCKGMDPEDYMNDPPHTVCPECKGQRLRWLPVGQPPVEGERVP